MVLRELVRVQIAPNGGHCATQFLPVVTVAWVAEAAEPLVGMGLQDRAARADHFPALAPGVAGGTEGTQATLRLRPVLCPGQSALAGCLARAINVEDDPLVACSINKGACLSLVVQRAREQIGEKERAQGFCGSPGEAGKKARERRAGGQLVASEERHEGRCPGSQPLVKLLQGAFATDGIAQEYGEKVDHFVVSEAAARKAHLRGDGVEDAKCAKMLDDEHHFPQPTRG